jgi:ribosomal protein S18 acetylase RimI-like enzyme
MRSEVIIEPFRKSDASQVVAMWNDALAEEDAGKEWHLRDHLLSEQRLEEMVRNPNYDARGSLVCRAQGRVVGYGRAVVKRVGSYEEENLEELPSYLEGLVVDRHWRRRGLGTRLLEKLEAYASAEGKDVLQTACWYSPIANLYFLLGSSGHRFLLGRGYEDGPPEMRLRLMLDGFSLRQGILEARARLKEEGIEVTYCGDSQGESFAELARKHFDSWWYLMFRPNLEREKPRPVLIAAEGSRVVGFIGFADVNERGWADFVLGVSPDYRRRGIASVLVNVWASEVKAKGAVESQIDTGVNNPARHIYLDAGYEKLGEFTVHLTKKLR